MRLLLDTHVVISMVNNPFEAEYPVVRNLLISNAATGVVSVASLWEIAIKSRLGKLGIAIPVEGIPDFLDASGVEIITITVPHVIAIAMPEPPTRDPFDRLLLAQCQTETIQLVTVDRALAGHPLSFRA